MFRKESRGNRVLSSFKSKARLTCGMQGNPSMCWIHHNNSTGFNRENWITLETGYSFFQSFVKDYVWFSPAAPSVLLEPPFEPPPWLYGLHKIWLESFVDTIYSLNFSWGSSWYCISFYSFAYIATIIVLSYLCSLIKQLRNRWEKVAPTD